MKVNEVTKGRAALGGLRGILLRDEGETLIVRASESDVKAFGAKAGQPLMLRHGSMSMDVGAAYNAVNGDSLIVVRPGELLYNANGDAVMCISDVEYRRDTFDVSTYGDLAAGGRRYAFGHRTRIRISGEGIE